MQRHSLVLDPWAGHKVSVVGYSYGCLSSMVYPHIGRPSSLPLLKSKSSVVGDVEKATGEAEVEPLLCAIRSQISLALMRSATVHELDSLVQFALRLDFQGRFIC